MDVRLGGTVVTLNGASSAPFVEIWVRNNAEGVGEEAGVGPGPLPRLSDTASSCPHAFSLIPAHALWRVILFLWPWVGPAVLVSKTRRQPPRKVKQGFRIPTREPQLVPPGPLATPGTTPH